MFQNIGTSPVFRLFALTNTLIGDPSIRIKIPNQPNLKITPADILLTDNVINDSQDSTEIKIILNNFGLKDSSQFNYSIQHSASGNIIKTFSGRRDLPNFKDTLSIWVGVKDLSGENWNPVYNYWWIQFFFEHHHYYQYIQKYVGSQQVG